MPPTLPRASNWRHKTCRNMRKLSELEKTHFDIVATVKYARFPEEPCTEDAPLVQQVSHGICILANTHRHTDHSLIHNSNTVAQHTQVSKQNL